MERRRPLPDLVLLHLGLYGRPGSDKAHLPLEHVNQLGHLVQTCFTEEGSEGVRLILRDNLHVK